MARATPKAVEALKGLWRTLIHGPGGEVSQTLPGRVVRWARIVVLILAAVMTMSSVLLVAGAWRNDLAIGSNMGVAAAEVLSAGPRRSTIEFVTPDRVTYRPELGVLYPSELDTGMRIYVEYDKSRPRPGAGAAPQCLAGVHPGRLRCGGQLAAGRPGTVRPGRTRKAARHR